MWKLALLLFVVLAVETYGVVGAWQTQKITRTCKMQVGPLCYAWEENTLGKLIGETATDDIEAAFSKAKDKWQRDVADKMKKKGKSDKTDFEKSLKELGKSIEDSFDDAKDAVGDKVEELNK